MTATATAVARDPARRPLHGSIPGHDHGRPLVVDGVVGAVFLALGVLVWWHLWSDGFGGALPTGSLDVGAGVWWLAWVPHVLAQGGNPFFTRAMDFPAGVNVLANTSYLLVGLVLSPITVTAGPVAAYTVALVLAPALDAFVAYRVFRRYAPWAPGAFVGGLFYGFGPFVSTDLRFGHLNVTTLVLPPLALVVVDRLVRLRTGSPWRAGLWLGLLVVAQFFVSAEVLAMGVAVGACGVVIVALSGWRRFREGVPYTSRALGTALALVAVVLAFPLWWYVAGPRHFTGAVWADMTGLSASLQAFVVPHGALAGVVFLSGGNGDYLGIPVVVVLLAGVLRWRQDRTLCFAVGMAAVSAVLAMGTTLHVGRAATGVPLPAWPLLHLPLLSSIAASRFAAFVDLFAGFALALVLDHAWRSLSARRRARQRWWLAPSVVLVVACACLAPAALVAPWVYPAQRLPRPSVVSALRRLPAGTVVREYPVSTGTDGDALVWQARSGLSYRLTTGYAIVPGPDGRAATAPTNGPLGLVFAAAALGTLPARPATSLVDSVRAQAFAGGAQAVVVVTPSPGGTRLIALLTRALGEPAVSGGGALWLAPGARR